MNDAMMLFEQQRFNSAASRAYYASYQAMWGALGDPVEGKVWKHLAIIEHFVGGYWFAPGHDKKGPDLLEDEDFAFEVLIPRNFSSDEVLEACHRECIEIEDEYDLFFFPIVLYKD